MRHPSRIVCLSVTCVLVALLTSSRPVATQSASYGVTDFGENVILTAIEPAGFPQVHGTSYRPDPMAITGAWPSIMRELGTLGGATSEALAASYGGIVGRSETAAGHLHAFLFQSRTMVDLGTLGGSYSAALGVNEWGVVVGVSETASGVGRPFVYQDGTMSELPVTLGGAAGAAFGINSAGHIVGWAEQADGQNRAFLYRDGETMNLGSLGGGSEAFAISDSGVIVGRSRLASGINDHAFRWDNGVMQDLGTLGGESSEALAINADGTIAGWAENAAGEKRAVIWRNGVIQDLNDLIPPGSGWELVEARGIGSQDAVVGWGRRSGVVHGFLATPPIDVELNLMAHHNDQSTNFPNPHETGELLLGATVYNWGHFAATNVVITDTISGPVEYVSWDGGDCVQDGQQLTCRMPTVELFGRDLMISVRTTGPGEITHSATISAADAPDPNPSNNTASETNTAVSLASLTLERTMVVGGESVFSRATLTSPAPTGGARVDLESSRPDVATVPEHFDVLEWSNGGLYREFYVHTQAVSAPVTVDISGTYGQRTYTVPLTVMPQGSSWPFGETAWPIPGTIQAEDFDEGGEGAGYHDTTGGNDGNAYRNTNVDIEATTDTGGGFNVGWMAAGEWLAYTADVRTAGAYRLDLRVAANGAGGRLHVEFDGVDKTGPLTIPNTGGWQSWTTLSVPVTLAAGPQRVRLMVDAASASGVVGNVNFLTLTSTGPGSTPYNGTPVGLPGVVQAENFDNGGSGVAYHDMSAGNSGGVYRSTDVDVQATSDSGGGYNVGWMSPGEWLVYSVEVPSAGNYQLDLRVAANGAGGRVHVEFEGVDKTGAMTIPNTGGWQSWTTISAPVSLSAGSQRMRVVVDAAGPTGVVGNLNYVQVTGGAPSTPEDIVIYASDVPAAALHGAWSHASDASSPGSVKLQTPDNGVAHTSNPLAAPEHYVDVTFTPVANTPYTLWLRLKALGDSKWNDAVWVQFSGAHAGGGPIYMTNTTSGLLVNLATDSTASSLNNWGWDNGAYWLSQETTFTFPGGGTQTLRIQVREDGVELDQIVLSPTTYLESPPGGPTNDSTIVAKP